MIPKNEDSTKKHIDENQYNTVFIKSEKRSENKNEHVSTVIDLLTNDHNKDIKHDALAALRNNKGIELLLEAIQKTDDRDKKQKLIAACWESGINCAKYLSTFVDLAIGEDYSGCLECMTVIEDMVGPFNIEDLNKAKEKLLKSISKADVKNEKKPLLQNIIDIVSGFQ